MAAEFFRCHCGKLHTQSGIWWSGTVCPGCGRRLTVFGPADESEAARTGPAEAE